jgi:hypothetical protein
MVARTRLTGKVGERETPGTVPDPGKSMVTVSLAEPPNPFFLA